MDTLLGILAFATFVVAQVAAVIAVSIERQGHPQEPDATPHADPAEAGLDPVGHAPRIGPLLVQSAAQLTLAARVVCLGLALAGLAIGPALAEPPPVRPAVTVEAVLPGCRSLVATQGIPTTVEAGFCSGLIDGLLYLGAMIPADFCFVVPSRIPHYRVVAAIVDEIEPIYPSVTTQHFRGLAIQVLEYKWPCHVDPKVLPR